MRNIFSFNIMLCALLRPHPPVSLACLGSCGALIFSTWTPGRQVQDKTVTACRIDSWSSSSDCPPWHLLSVSFAQRHQRTCCSTWVSCACLIWSCKAISLGWLVTSHCGIASQSCEKCLTFVQDWIPCRKVRIWSVRFALMSLLPIFGTVPVRRKINRRLETCTGPYSSLLQVHCTCNPSLICSFCDCPVV